MSEIVLPRLVASRTAARPLAAHLVDVTGERVVVNCRDLRSASSSFADELVKVVLTELDAGEMVVLGGDADFIRYVHESAKARSVDDRVSERPAGSEVEA